MGLYGKKKRQIRLDRREAFLAGRDG